MELMLRKRAVQSLLVAGGVCVSLSCASGHDPLVASSPDGGLMSTLTDTTSAAEPDPFGLAGKGTEELDQLIEDEKASGEAFYSRPLEDQQRLEALYRARAKQLGKRPLEERLVFTDKTERGGPAPEEPPPPEEAARSSRACGAAPGLYPGCATTPSAPSGKGGKP